MHHTPTSPTSLLRPFQKQTLETLENRSHVVCIAPTGSGKSRIYETWAQRPDSRMLLISPLVALARQQLEQLRRRGVDAHMGQPPQKSGVWIMSPERCCNPTGSTIRSLQHWRPTIAVVDECHCLWEWGHDFRPAFREIPALIKSLGIQKSLWLTATLSPDARRDLQQSMEDGPSHRVDFLGTFVWPSGLELQIEQVSFVQRLGRLHAWCRSISGKKIVFVNTRKAAERISATLPLSRAYHAGMSLEERTNIEAVMTQPLDESGSGVSTLISTSAYGMGMHNPEITGVLFFQPPHCLTQLAQGVGRCGRMGKGSARVWWESLDLLRLENHSEPSAPARKHELLAVGAFLTCNREPTRWLESYFNG